MKIAALAALALASVILLPAATSAAATAPGLATAESFAVLAASTVTNTGPSVINGDIGVSPGTAATGFSTSVPPGPGIVNGTVYAGEGVAAQAQVDAGAAYNDLAIQGCDDDLTGQDLGGLTLTPGVHCFSSSAQLTGILTLDAGGDPAAVFIFRIGSTLTTASASGVLLTGSAETCNVFWQVGTAATLGADTDFVGTALAGTSITATTGASVMGRLLALDGAVTLDTNAITAPSCADGGTTDGGTTDGGTTDGGTTDGGTTDGGTTDGGTTDGGTTDGGTTDGGTTDGGTTDGGTTDGGTTDGGTTDATTTDGAIAGSTTGGTTSAGGGATSDGTTTDGTTDGRTTGVATPSGDLPTTGSNGTVALSLLGALSVAVGAVARGLSRARQGPRLR